MLAHCGLHSWPSLLGGVESSALKPVVVGFPVKYRHRCRHSECSAGVPVPVCSEFFRLIHLFIGTVFTHESARLLLVLHLSLSAPCPLITFGTTSKDSKMGVMGTHANIMEGEAPLAVCTLHSICPLMLLLCSLQAPRDLSLILILTKPTAFPSPMS